MPPINSKAFINVDLGEAYGNFKCGPDDELFPLIDQANVACGFQYVQIPRLLIECLLMDNVNSAG